MSETNQTESATPDIEYEQFYAKILGDLRLMTDLESTASTPYKHAIGLRIFQARNELMSIRPVKDEKGWNKELGMLTEKLEKDLDYKRTTLNYCHRFATRFPIWDVFARTEFDVVRGDVNEIGNSRKVLGKDLPWNEVISLISQEKVKLGPKVKPSTTTQSASQSSESPQDWVALVIRLPIHVAEKLSNIASAQKQSKEDVISSVMGWWVDDYTRKNSVAMWS